MDKITKDTIIGEVVMNHPEVIDTLMGLGVHCVGCGAMHMETIEMGFKGHGMTDEEVDEAVERLNKVAEEFARLKKEKQEQKEQTKEEAKEDIHTDSDEVVQEL